jgi:hypothetical protein
MRNVFFPEEELTQNDLYFMCTMIERVARKLKVRNKKVVNSLGYEELYKKMSLANVLHSENPNKVVEDWIDEYGLEEGKFDILDVDKKLVEKVPSPLQIGKVYRRLIEHTLQEDEDYIQGIIRVYNAPICEIIDDYNSSAYYEPTPVIVKSYYNNAF